MHGSRIKVMETVQRSVLGALITSLIPILRLRGVPLDLGGAASINMSALDICIAAVKMINKSDTYAPSCFKVALHKKYDGYAFIKKSRSHKPPNMQQDVLETLHDDTGISGIAAHLISVHTNENQLVLLYIVPTATDDNIKEDVTFVNMDDLIDCPEWMENEFERDLVQHINQWLYQKHTIPFVNLDTLFSNGVLGVVNEIVHNPLYQAHVHPPEDTLVICFNNPILSLNNDKK